MAEWVFVAVIVVSVVVNAWIDHRHNKRVEQFCERADHYCKELEKSKGESDG